METASNSTLAGLDLQVTGSSGSQTSRGGGNEYLYILIVMSFYGVFLFGIMLGYMRSKRREKKSNVFTHLLYEEEKREWGAMQKKHSLTFPSISGLRSVQVSLPFSGPLYDGKLPAPLSCALCSMEQSSVSSLCSSADVHFAIEEESDSGTAEGVEDGQKGCSDSNNDSVEILKERKESRQDEKGTPQLA